MCLLKLYKSIREIIYLFLSLIFLYLFELKGLISPEKKCKEKSFEIKIYAS